MINHKIRLDIERICLRRGELVFYGSGNTGRGLDWDAHLIEVIGPDDHIIASFRSQLSLPAHCFVTYTQPIHMIWNGMITEVAGALL